ncbi:MAG TPA: hypothetical protein VM283_00665, partial [Armatimonadota bacterium]|nr:hypothetical protein [Armatimonadota bacterium]
MSATATDHYPEGATRTRALERLGRVQAVLLDHMYTSWRGYGDAGPADYMCTEHTDETGGYPWWRYSALVVCLLASPGLPATSQEGSLRVSISRAVRRLCDRGLLELLGKDKSGDGETYVFNACAGAPSGEKWAAGQDCGRVEWVRLTSEGEALLLSKVSDKPSPTGLLDWDALVNKGRVRWLP